MITAALYHFNIETRRLANDWLSGRIRFTGWKPERDDPTGERGVIGQWVFYGTPGHPNYYVNLPGLQYGEFKPKDEFNIGMSRVFPGDDVEALLKTGLDRLLALVTGEMK